MKNIICVSLCFMGASIFLTSCASQQGAPATSHQVKEVRAQHKQEVSSMYKECLQQKHGVMLNCIDQKIEALGDQVEIFNYSLAGKKDSNWQAPKEYTQRKNPISQNEKNFAQGEEIYKTYCAVCHGVDGKGRAADEFSHKKIPDLTSLKLLNKEDGDLFWKITEGNWPMPAFWEGDVLSEKDLWVLIHYLRRLSIIESKT